MISVELIEELENNPDLIWDDDFIKEIPNKCLINFIENNGWKRSFSNLNGPESIFYSYEGEFRRIIIPSDNKNWIDTSTRWSHNIHTLTKLYDIDRHTLILEILGS